MEIVASLVLITYGVLIAILIQPLSEWLSRKSLRKRTAIVLSREIITIRSNAEGSLMVHKKHDEEMDKIMKATSGLFKQRWIDDTDFPTLAFRSMIDKVSVFDEDVSSSIQNIYNYVGYAHHWRSKNDKYILDFNNMCQMDIAGQLNDVGVERLKHVMKLTVNTAELYLHCVSEIRKACDETLPKLEEITKLKLKAPTLTPVQISK